MTSTSSSTNNGLQQAATNSDASSFDAALARDPSVPAPELARRLDADMAQVFYSSPSETCVESDPARTASQAPAASVEACHLLNQCLVNCIDLRLQCKQAQWELSGADVNALVHLCAQTAAAFEQHADRLAARITALGGVADGTLDTVAEHSGLNAYPRVVTRDLQHVDAVASALAVAVFSLRLEFAAMDEQCDMQTSELLTELELGLESHRAGIVEAQQQVMAVV